MMDTNAVAMKWLKPQCRMRPLRARPSYVGYAGFALLSEVMKTSDEKFDPEFPERDLSELKKATEKFLNLLRTEYVRSLADEYGLIRQKEDTPCHSNKSDS